MTQEYLPFIARWHRHPARRRIAGFLCCSFEGAPHVASSILAPWLESNGCPRADVLREQALHLARMARVAT
jgi:hypothetical protein